MSRGVRRLEGRAGFGGFGGAGGTTPGNREAAGFRPSGVKPHSTHAPAVVTAVLAALLGLVVASCGARTATGPGDPAATTTATSTPVGAPALDTAAALVQPVLEERFADSFAGLEVRHDEPALVVHRRPDPRLDAEVTRLAPHVQVIFRDAEHTLVEMVAAVRRIEADEAHWRDLGVRIVTMGPAVDGSGVEVRTTSDPAGVRERLEARYPGMSFTVDAGPAVVPPTHSGSLPPVDRRTAPPPKDLDPPPTR
ncbi:hypothetical protein [Saccharothrix sp. HUAS TT1]|uniref:hypothetical protein n=1 Tax=unclassified Saccharothrix TaxID=2593673 RepID=UPI00345B6ED1